jgi:AcrR family transcriptional regulator
VTHGVRLELLSEGGVGGFCVHEVARRSGVAKTTIYRHWPTPKTLVVDACSRLGAEQEIPDTGSLEGDLSAILTNIAHLLQAANRSAVLRSVIDSAERDPEFAEIVSRIQRGRGAPLAGSLTPGDKQRPAPGADRPLNNRRSPTRATLLPPLVLTRPIDDKFVNAIIKCAIESD